MTMKMPSVLPLLVASVVLLGAVGCSRSNEAVSLAEGRIERGEYHNPDLGWQFRIPEGWKALDQEEIAVIEGKGKALVEESLGEEVSGGQVQLLVLRKDDLNLFSATAMAYDPVADGPYEETQTVLHEVILEAFTNQGIKHRHTSSTEVIDGVTFTVLDVTILSPDGTRGILHQSMYDALLGARSLTVSVNSSNERDRETLLTAWRASKFTGGGKN